MQHIKAEVCAKKGEIQKFYLHSSSSNEEFLAQDPICNLHIAKNKHNKQTNTTTSKNKWKKTHKLQVCEVDSTWFFKLCDVDSTLQSLALATQVCDL